MLQFLVHAGHHTDVVIVYQVDFFEVKILGKLACLISEEEVSHGLRLKWQVCTQFHSVQIGSLAFTTSDTCGVLVGCASTLLCNGVC